jgi:hypothetical protein
LTTLSADQLSEVVLEAMAAARRGDPDWRMVCVVQSDDGQAQVMFSIELVQENVWRFDAEEW